LSLQSSIVGDHFDTIPIPQLSTAQAGEVLHMFTVCFTQITTMVDIWGGKGGGGGGGGGAPHHPALGGGGSPPKHLFFFFGFLWGVKKKENNFLGWEPPNS